MANMKTTDVKDGVHFLIKLAESKNKDMIEISVDYLKKIESIINAYLDLHEEFVNLVNKKD